MADNGVKTLGFIGFSDAYGESWLTEINRLLDLRGIRVVDVERYNRADTSVTGQVLKLMAANPDAILIAGAGTPSVRRSSRWSSATTRAGSTRRTASRRPSS